MLPIPFFLDRQKAINTCISTIGGKNNEYDRLQLSNYSKGLFIKLLFGSMSMKVFNASIQEILWEVTKDDLTAKYFYL